MKSPHSLCLSLLDPVIVEWVQTLFEMEGEQEEESMESF